MKEVQDRVVQFSNRYKLTNAETGEVLGTFDFDEVTGTVQQVGTEIDAELFDSIASDLAANAASILAVDKKADTHIARVDNPHSVTKAQIGLGNVVDERQYSEQNPPPYPVLPNGTYPEMTVGNSTNSENSSISEKLNIKTFSASETYNKNDCVNYYDKLCISKTDGNLGHYPSLKPTDPYWWFTGFYAEQFPIKAVTSKLWLLGSSTGSTSSNEAVYKNSNVFIENGRVNDARGELAAVNGNYPNMTVGDSEHANNADTAENADNAGFAEQANSCNTATHAISADSAGVADIAINSENLTKTINGKNITDIFEADGITAKKASYATNASSATSAGSANIASKAGTADSATKAEQDGEGNVISSTYVTNTQLSNSLSEKANTSGQYDDLTAGAAIRDNAGNVISSTYIKASDLLNKVYPIGSIYMNYTDNSSPASKLGGSWTQISSGQFLLSTGTSYTFGSTGGQENVTLTVNQIPAHSHYTTVRLKWQDTATSQNALNTSWASQSGHLRVLENPQPVTSSVGGGQSHNNMPPYRVVSMWRRTA